MRITSAFLAIAFLTVLSSCEKAEPEGPVDTGYTHGVFISNEGSFLNSNGSISYLDQDSMMLHNNLFYQVNNRPLGDIVQSIAIHDDRAYIVVNNSQKIEVVDLETFISIGVIDGLSYPRHFIGIDQGKGYVSNGAMEGMVYVIDLVSLNKIDSIQVGFGPEQMIMHKNKIYVANSGAWTTDNSVSVIDYRGDELIETIQVGDNPVAFTQDMNNDLWVLCMGKVVYDLDWSIIEETESSLVKINTSSMQVDRSITIGQIGDYFQPKKITCDLDRSSILFTEAEGVYKMDINADVQPSTPLVPMSFYGLGIDPDNGNIYGLSAGDYTSPGYLFRFQEDGTRIDSLEVGIAPNMVLFN